MYVYKNSKPAVPYHDFQFLEFVPVGTMHGAEQGNGEGTSGHRHQIRSSFQSKPILGLPFLCVILFDAWLLLQRLKKLKNFNTFMAVVGGLTHSSLARLSKTFACLSQESRRVKRDRTRDHTVCLTSDPSFQDLSEFADLLSSNSNFSAYRKAFSDCRGFKIPIM